MSGELNWKLEEPAIWAKSALNDFKSADEKTRKRIITLIKSIYKDGLLGGIGKPEKLRHRTEYSRRINREDRLIYDLSSEEILMILSVSGHYE